MEPQGIHGAVHPQRLAPWHTNCGSQNNNSGHYPNNGSNQRLGPYRWGFRRSVNWRHCLIKLGRTCAKGFPVALMEWQNSETWKRNRLIKDEYQEMIEFFESCQKMIDALSETLILGILNLSLPLVYHGFFSQLLFSFDTWFFKISSQRTILTLQTHRFCDYKTYPH